MQPCKLGHFTYDPETGEVRHGTQSIRLRHKTNVLLQHLLEHAGQPISRDRLFEIGWQQTVLRNAAINKVIAEIRTAFNDDAKNPAYLKTIPKLGYQWVGPTPQALESELSESEINEVQANQQVQVRGREANLNYGKIVLVAVVAFAIFAWWFWPRSASNEPVQNIALLPLINLTGNDSLQPYVAGLPHAVGNHLALLGFETVPFSQVQSRLSQMPAQLDIAPDQFQRLESELQAAEVVVAILEKADGQLVIRGKVHTRQQAPQSFLVMAQDGDQLGIKWARTLVRMLSWQRVKQEFAVLQPQSTKAQLYFWDGLQQLMNGQVKQARTSLAFGLEEAPQQIGLNLLYKEATMQDLCGHRDFFLAADARCESLSDLQADPFLASGQISWVETGERLGLLADVMQVRLLRLTGHGDQTAAWFESKPTAQTPRWLVGLWLAERAVVAQELGQDAAAMGLFKEALQQHRSAAFVYTQPAYLESLAKLAAKQNKGEAEATYAQQAELAASLLAVEP